MPCVASLTRISARAPTRPTFGLSLGGFEAIYGAAAAPEELTPALGVSWFPPSDFPSWVTYLVDDLPAVFPPGSDVLAGYDRFFEPYLRRVYAVTGGHPGAPGADYAGLRLADLAAGMRTDFLLVHDTWDTLVPVAQTVELVQATTAQGFWFPHTTGIDFETFARDHRQPCEGLRFSTAMLFSYTYLLTRLVEPAATAVALYDWFELAGCQGGPDPDEVELCRNCPGHPGLFAYLRAQQLPGHDISWLVPRLVELADPRLTLHDVSVAGANAPGHHLVGLFLNGIWGAGLGEQPSSEAVIAYLQTHGLQ